jgi:hypothetical protein
MNRDQLALFPLDQVAQPVCSDAWGRRPFWDYMIMCQLMRRGRVPWHYTACADPKCGHAMVWHRTSTRYRPCDTGTGCKCRRFVRHETERVPGGVRVLVPGVAR